MAGEAPKRPESWEELEHLVEDDPDAAVQYLCPDCGGEVTLEFHPYPRRFVVITCKNCGRNITIDGLPPKGRRG